MTQPKPLTVYRASAGSGKTFTLAVRFIELLIKNPTAYREILAVTFTNKATEEMKTRILSQLYGISHALPDSNSYLDRITADLRLPANDVRQRAGAALTYILHDYSRFNVETIDAFFQRILRNLARELELTTSLRVELDQEEVEGMAVDKLISGLKANDKVLRWIMSYIEQQIDDDQNWNVIRKIKRFGKKIYERPYKDNADALNAKLASKDFFDNYQKSLRAIVADANEEMRGIAEKFFSLLDSGGFSIDNLSYGKSGPAGYFLKLRDGDYLDDDKTFNSRTQDAATGYEGWIKKADRDQPIAGLAREQLTPLLQQAEKQRKEKTRLVRTANAILSNLNELRLLNDIQQTVTQMNKDANQFLLADTQDVLNQLMKDSDTPFVYEKIGGRISHTMIDEFQDTSVIQWSNFKKLLLECLAHKGSENLIVGDVKQSIYRWRNGDWRLLNNISDDPSLRGKEISVEQLSTNYRSERNIILFNNEFFTLAATCEQQVLNDDGNPHSDTVSQIYSPEGVTQHCPEGKTTGGLVDITLLTGDNYDEKCLQLTRQHIQTLADAGASDDDIAIIVRNNADIYRLANWLQAQMPSHTFVSDEAFQLDASLAVNIIVDAMKALCDPRDTLILVTLAKEYQTHVCQRDVSEARLRKDNTLRRSLPQGFLDNREQLLAMPLADMAETIVALFRLDRLNHEAAYINAFFDQIDAFTRKNTPDLGAFLEAWDDNIKTKTVKGGDLKGIRLLTIHKSKGLEFDHVIVPYCNWQLDKGTTLWCSTDVEPFAEMPVVPVVSTKTKNTVFDRFYHEERLQNAIDNLNLLYVAFTRAGKNLFVIGENVATGKGKTKTISHTRRSGLLQELLPQLAKNLPGSRLTGDTTSKEDELHLAFGTLFVANRRQATSANVFLAHATDEEVSVAPRSSHVEFRQSNRSRMFVADDSQTDNRQYITQGTVLHRVLSQISSTDDIPRVIDNFLQEGVISENDETMNRQTLATLLRRRIEENSNPLVKRWFSTDVIALNECSILATNPADSKAIERRPDRIVVDGDKITVIDFKFGNPHPAYRNQVATYTALLRGMGYSDVTGYLWYVYSNKIEQVETV